MERGEKISPLELFVHENEPAGDADAWRDQLAAALASAPAAGEAVAWMHAEDPARVVSALQKATSERDGGAFASSLRPHNIALGRLAAPQASEAVRHIQAADEIDRLKGVLLIVRHRIGQHDLFTAIKEIDAALSAQPGAQTGGSDAK